MIPSTILEITDIEKARTVSELDEWIKAKQAEFESTQEGIMYLRFREGLSKQFAEEIIPLARYAKYRFGFESKALIKPVIGNQQFDGIIIDGNNEFKVETTLAFNGYQEHHRMKILSEKKMVSAWGEIHVQGNKNKGHEYKVINKSGSDEQIYGQVSEFLQCAYNKKNLMNYSGVDTLVIAFEDFLKFTDQRHISSFFDIFSKYNFSQPSIFNNIWVVGLSGKIGFQLNAN